MAYDKEEGEKPSKTEDEQILDDARKYLKACIDDESVERAKMRDDLRFAALDQWPVEIRNEREGDIENGPRPCLTIDKLSQYTTQVVNDARQGRPGINVRPQDDAADVETAKILKGLVRNIEDQSKADIAYTAAIESAVKIGLGYFRITTEYVSDDSFDQEIFIRSIPNTFSVYLGKHLLPDGSDTEIGFVMEAMPIDKFKATYPKAKAEHKDFEGVESDIIGDWKTEETITVVEEFCLERHAEELLFLSDGTTMTAVDYASWPKEGAGTKPDVQDRRLRVRKQLKWRKMTAVEVLEKRDLPGQYIPIVEVIGRETWVDGKRILWGLVRPAKDSLRMYNYWASTLTEKMALAPKTPFVGAKGQFDGMEERWKKANRVNYSYLEYNAIDVNGNAIPAPQRQGATPIEAAYMSYMQVIEHDVQTSLGMFKAAVGETESQQSGRAILALQRESDTGTYHFGANLGISIRHAGVIIVDLIPHYYDTKRIVRILGEDGQPQTVTLDPEQPQAMRQIQTGDGIKRIFNPSVGKYDVSITTGPGYNTKRMEAQATFVELSKGAAEPASAAVLRYLTVKNSDFHGSDEAAKMLRALLPPQALQALDSGEQVPPAVQAKMQQMGAQMQAMQQAGAELQQENMQLKAGARVEMQKIAARRAEADEEFRLQKDKQDRELQLQRDKAMKELDLKRAIALAEFEIEKMKLNAAADADVDTAIAKIKSMVMLHEAKMQGAIEKDAAVREGAEGAQAQSGEQSMAAMQGMHKEFLSAVSQIVESLQAKKTVNLLRRDGQLVGAEVTPA